MSQTQRRQNFLKPNIAEYPAFPAWNATLVDADGVLIRLVPCVEEHFASIPQEAREVCGVPTMICLHPQRRMVEVYPVPDRAYDIISETKSWSAA